MRKMTAKQLEYRVHKGLKKHNLSLRLGFGYINVTDGAVCAIGAALAYAAKTPREIVDLVTTGDTDISDFSRHRTARTAARILNHRLTPRDMVMLEMGFEGYEYSRYLKDKDAIISDDTSVSPFRRNPFYKLGQKLRAESLRSPKAA